VPMPAAYARTPLRRGSGKSRRNTRSGVTPASATSGGSAKPKSSSKPVAIATTAGYTPGGGSDATTAPDINAASASCARNANASPIAHAATPSTANCTTKSASVRVPGAPKQRSIAAVST